MKYFFGIGAQKAGTTSLHEILKQIPDIALPKHKETQEFTYNPKCETPKEYLEIYFQTNITAEVVGEIDPSYIFIEGTAEKIKNFFAPSKPKIIVILRNPIERAFSQYLMSKKRGYENASFEKAIQRKIKNPMELEHLDYIKRSQYYRQLQEYYNEFEDILVINFETEFIENRKETIQKILEFLEIDTDILKFVNMEIKANVAQKARIHWVQQLMSRQYTVKDVVKNVVPYKLRRNFKSFVFRVNLKSIEKGETQENLSENFKKELYETYFKEDIENLEMLTQKDFSNWKMQ